MSDAVLEQLLAELVLANRILAREEVIDDFGHVSVLHPHDPGRYVLSRSRSPKIVSREDIAEFTPDGTVIEPNGRRPYLERVIHGAVYEARPGSPECSEPPHPAMPAYGGIPASSGSAGRVRPPSPPPPSTPRSPFAPPG